MRVNIQAHRFTADSKLIEYIEKKVSKISVFNDKIINVGVFLILDNVAHNIKDKVAEIQVRIPGHDFFVKHSSKSFEESFDAALDSLMMQMKRKKEKMTA
ncbi:MAG: HPF/RaiA family ribosome-associated protein [Ginsengibacter sp.]